MFYLVLLYIITFYLQPGGRVPALGAIRFELILGGTIVLVLFIMKGNSVFRSNQLNRSILVLFCSFLLSFFGAFWTHTASHAIDILVQILKLFCVYLMIVGTVDTEKKLKLFMLVYMSAICFYYTEPLLMNNMHYSGGMMHLMGIGQYAHYNSLGGITASNLSFLSQLFPSFPPFLKLLCIISMGIGMRVIILTGSRTAYVGVMVLGLLWIWLSKRRWKNLILVTLTGLLLFTVMPPEYKERFYSLGKSRDVIEGIEKEDSMAARWEILQDAWVVFLKYPLVGCGLDSFYQVRNELYGRFQQTHNLYMQVLTDVGLIGGIAFGYFIIVLFQYLKQSTLILRRIKKENSYLMFMVKALYMFLIMRLTVGMFGHDLYENYWWFIAGLTMVVYTLVNKEERKQTFVNV